MPISPAWVSRFPLPCWAWSQYLGPDLTRQNGSWQPLAAAPRLPTLDTTALTAHRLGLPLECGDQPARHNFPRDGIMCRPAATKWTRRTEADVPPIATRPVLSANTAPLTRFAALPSPGCLAQGSAF